MGITLDSGIDVSRTGNKYGAWKIWQKFEVFVSNEKAEKINIFPIFHTKFNNRRAFNKAVGPGKKNLKSINVGPMFIPDYRV